MFRIEPKLPPSELVTYQIDVPARCWRQATCDEVACQNHLHGWRLRADVLSERDLYLATHSGRKYELLNVTAGETWLVYEAGQTCFGAAKHRVRADVPERYLVVGGDHRGNPRGYHRAHVSAADWLEDFAEHQDKIATALSRG